MLRLKGLPAQRPAQSSDLRAAEVADSGKGPLSAAHEAADALSKQAALARRPRGIFGKGWNRGDEKQYQAIRNTCLESKPRCTTKYSKGKRVRKCYRDCERVAAATVNKRRKTEGRTDGKKKTSRRKKR